MNQHLQNILNIIQQKEDLTADQKNAVAKSLKDADKELEITSFKLDRTEKIKKTTAILLEETIEELEQKRKAVEVQNRELEIESALERVRTVAMSMQQPDNLLSICEILFIELQKLGFSKLRNSMINIHNDDKAYFLNYDFSAYAGKTVTTILYNSHPVVESHVKQIKSSKDAFAEMIVTGEELENWRKFRKENGELDDPRLGNITALYYYFYSVATGDVGISNFEPVSEKQLGILKRFRNVFDLAYKRYTDITKAEAQTREAQIETALEKVRSRSMGMQKSEELKEVIKVVYDQFVHLNILVEHAGFIVDYKERDDMYIWLADKHEIPFQVTIPYFHSAHWNSFIEAKEKGQDFFANNLSFEEKNRFYQDLFKLFPVADEAKKYYFNCPGLAISTVLLENVALYIENFSAIPYSDEENNTLMRFGKVFQQTYTRFLDLQKAEAQARESQIQLALERARTQSMIMHHSKELDDTLRVFHEQVLLLNIDSAFSFLWLPDEENDRHIFWAAWAENTPLVFRSKAINYPLERNEPATAQCLIDWKGNEQVVSYHVPPAGVESYFAAWQELIAGVEQLKPGYFSDGLYYVEAFMKYGCFGIMVQDKLKEEDKNTLARFAVEFERAYTRFLDLQKAEAQARESQVEAALEKVRSRSLAMHKSDELQEVITVVFEKLKELGVGLDAAGATICTFIEGSRDVVHWLASPDFSLSQSYKVPYFDHPIMADTWKARENGEDFFSKTYFFEEKNSFHKYLFEHSDYKFIPGELKNRVFASENYTLSVAGQKNSAITIYSFNNILPSVKDVETIKRFSKVFEQVYTRFLDLQKAEAQAREAQIEAALERVRSRSMGMQKSDDLRDVIQVIYDQLIQLDFKMDAAGFALDFRESDDWNLLMVDHSGPYPGVLHIPYFDHPMPNAILEAKKNGDELLVINLTFEEKNALMDQFFKYIPPMPEGVKEALYNAPGYVISKVLLKNIDLYIQNYKGFLYTDAENATLIRFGKVFEQTYIRFNDLKKAEEQAREAVKRASVDRVRGEIASMRTTADLERIQPLIWNELTTLGVPFIRCGVFIMDEEKQQVQTLLSTPDGKAIATLHVPFEFDLSLITNGVDHWRKKTMYKEHWDAAAFSRSWTALSSLRDSAIDSPQAERPPENLYLHMLPFLQGMLYVGNDSSLNEYELQLVQILADAFSTAYARYEDFNKLESAKEQIERTLVDLKQAQAQLVQSEKMASLGELTAGIAHEIQNPLNFVNNFSELNRELLAELNEEIGKRNYEEVKIIAKDVAGNEEKINHHGKRADAIVKGMLQHSRTSAGQKEPTDINILADEYLRLAYHGLRAKDKSFNATLNTDYDQTLGKARIIPQDIGKVVLNLIINAFYAIQEKAKQYTSGTFAGRAIYEPIISLSTKKYSDKSDSYRMSISVKDNGNGIPQKIVDKIFQPFFTTKPTGQGTGLGLSLSYDIVKAHGGEIKVETKEGEGSEFIVVLPL